MKGEHDKGRRIPGSRRSKEVFRPTQALEKKPVVGSRFSAK